MSRFNDVAATNKTVNLAGGEAFKTSPELELVSALLTSFLEDKYYEKGEKRQSRIEELIPKIDPKFAAQASIFARNEFGMRSVSHVVAGQIAGTVKGEQWTKHYFDKVVRRPDDMLEILSYYQSKFGKTEPAALKKGFAQALIRFDAYQLAKYRGNGKSVKLVDVVNLVHPKPTEAITALVRDELRNNATFESKLSATKGDTEKKAEAWTDLIESRRIGYLALLRNLRNILQDAPEALPKALELLTNEKLIRKSLVLPFQMLTAYQELEKVNRSSDVLSALSRALDISFQNVPQFDGKTLVVVDHSGSMGAGYGSPFMKGAIFGLALARSSNADLMHFGSTAEYLSFNKSDSTLTLARWLDGLNKGYLGRWEIWGTSSATPPHEVGHGTNFHAIFQKANVKYDRIVIISDMQGWMGFNHPGSAFSEYKARTKSDPMIYSWDMAGHGTLQFPERNIAALAGWSEKVFDIMKLVETDKQALVNTIRKIEL